MIDNKNKLKIHFLIKLYVTTNATLYSYAKVYPYKNKIKLKICVDFSRWRKLAHLILALAFQSVFPNPSIENGLGRNMTLSDFFFFIADI